MGVVQQPRPLAALSSSLLARKGQARPALRPQAIVARAVPAEPSEDPCRDEAGGRHVVLTPAPQPPVPLATAPTPRRGPKVVLRSNAPARKAFTLRLDHERHQRLRLASALNTVSAQVLVTAALDQFLNTLPEIDALVRQSASTAPKR